MEVLHVTGPPAERLSPLRRRRRQTTVMISVIRLLVVFGPQNPALFRSSMVQTVAGRHRMNSILVVVARALFPFSDPPA